MSITSCRECGSNALSWFAYSVVSNGVLQGRLNTQDVKCLFVLGCDVCSETLEPVSADQLAERMTVAHQEQQGVTRDPR